jgi:hypothetical protein
MSKSKSPRSDQGLLFTLLKTTMNGLRTYEGGCHCARVRFRVTADLDTVILCNCSICTKKGIVHLIVAQEQFELLCGKDDLTTYAFNTSVAKHTFCKHCGVHPFYVPRSDPDKIDVNVRCIDEVDLATLKPKYFDGKHWEDAQKFWQQS